MAGGLKKSNIKKKSQRAELMAEEKRIEQEKEQAKKDMESMLDYEKELQQECN